jgi:3-phosphoshikimate 1-carboxyvinyltransferase
MLGALAEGTSTVRNALESDDIRSTIGALRALGAEIRRDRDLYVIEGARLREPLQVIDAGNSGTTARLMSGILAGLDGIAAMTGDGSLVKRPWPG